MLDSVTFLALRPGPSGSVETPVIVRGPGSAWTATAFPTVAWTGESADYPLWLPGLRLFPMESWLLRLVRPGKGQWIHRRGLSIVSPRNRPAPAGPPTAGGIRFHPAAGRSGREVLLKRLYLAPAPYLGDPLVHRQPRGEMGDVALRNLGRLRQFHPGNPDSSVVDGWAPCSCDAFSWSTASCSSWL